MKTNTDYAINKRNKEAIVYQFDDGSTVLLTKDDFASEEEFFKWKTISDENLHEIECNNRNNERYQCSLDAADYDGNNPGKEDSYFEKEEKERITTEFNARVHKAMSHCSETQQRRLWAVSEGLNSCEIAAIEGCAQQSVFESIEAGKKKFKKNF